SRQLPPHRLASRARHKDSRRPWASARFVLPYLSRVGSGESTPTQPRLTRQEASRLRYATCSSPSSPPRLPDHYRCRRGLRQLCQGLSALHAGLASPEPKRRGMLQLDTILALALLTSAPEGIQDAKSLEAYQWVRPALQAVAVQLELLDPREVRYIL